MPAKAPPIDKDAAKRFKLVRMHLNLGTQEMADLCNISQSYISRIEGGTREIPIHVLKTLFIKKNINPNHVILGGNEPIEYKGKEGNLVTNLRDLKADIEISKAQIRHLYSILNKSNEG